MPKLPVVVPVDSVLWLHLSAVVGTNEYKGRVVAILLEIGRDKLTRSLAGMTSQAEGERDREKNRDS